MAQKNRANEALSFTLIFSVLLRTDGVAAYETLGHDLIAQYQPATSPEGRLVQCLIDAEWRLMRIPTLESDLLAVAREELADSAPASRLETDAYLKQERSLKNLHIQENRIRRNREKDLKELNALQAARREAEEEHEAVKKPRTNAVPPAQATPSQPAAPEIGFEFETGSDAAKAAA